MTFIEKLASLFRGDLVTIEAPILGARAAVEKALANPNVKKIIADAYAGKGIIPAPAQQSLALMKGVGGGGVVAEALVLGPANGGDPLPPLPQKSGNCGDCCIEEIQRYHSSHWGPDRTVRVRSVFDQCSVVGRNPPYPEEYDMLLSELAAQFFNINATSIHDNLGDDGVVGDSGALTVTIMGTGQIGFGTNATIGRSGHGVKSAYNVSFSGLLRDGTPFAYVGLKRRAPSGTAQHASYPFKVIKMTQMHYLGQLFDADIGSSVSITNLQDLDTVDVEAVFGGDDIARYVLKGIVDG